MSLTETDLLTSRPQRDRLMNRVHALDKVKTLKLLPDGTHVTTQMVATYFEVSEEAVWSLVHDHRREVEANGYHVLSGAALTSFKEVSGLPSRTRSLALFRRRTVLNVAMLLRDSVIARQVRSYLLDTEEASRPQPPKGPVENSARADADTPTRLAADLRRFVEHTVGQRLGATLDERIDRGRPQPAAAEVRT